MPIIFISLNEEFTEKIRQYGFEAHTMKIEDYKPKRKTYYVSPANSLCFMDGGIDYALSRIIFPDIEKDVKLSVKKYGKTNLLGRKYLPIGSSIIIDYDNQRQRSLIISPTMLLPQDVSKTNNAYYATQAILYNILINRGEKLNDIDIIFTSFCCGYGKMSVDNSIAQIIRGINDFKNYKAQIINNNVIICEPNLNEQPNYYMNTEWKKIAPNEIQN